MTYGWAILIIAVVLGVLFQMGVFSGSALAPHAQPGSCQVERLAGQMSLEGQCTGLLPQYVSTWANPPAGYLELSSIGGLPLGSLPGSVFGWVYLSDYTGDWLMVNSWGPRSPGTAQARALSIGGSGNICFNAQNDDVCSNFILPLNTWSLIGYSYVSGTSLTIFYDSQSQNMTLTQALSTATGNGYIGSYIGGGGSYVWTGSLANIQVYNVTFSTNEAQALYLEGIGGAPIRPQNLVGWWPLNGNANDYSGNNNNGQISGGVSFNSSWQGAYTSP